MARKNKKKHPVLAVRLPIAGRPTPAASPPQPRDAYNRAAALAEKGDHAAATQVYEAIRPADDDAPLRALIQNDLAVLAAVKGNLAAAQARFQDAVALDVGCEPARTNLALLLEEDTAPTPTPQSPPPPATSPPPAPIKVAVLSFLFNWPSTGGGIVHTVELAHFLALAGYEVRHFYARCDAWEVGRVQAPVPFPSVPLDFDAATWDVRAIQDRYRRAVAEFDPDYVIITDSWNIKPLLAEAVRDYPFILRLQATECLCPLNNLRLLVEPDGRARQCPLHQLATPDQCARCVRERGRQSGSLHQAERALSGVGTAAYQERLVAAFRDAEAVLVVNPLAEAMVSPYCRSVRVVTAGMDPARFPWPWPGEAAPSRGVTTLLFAGLVDEWMKGFRVAHEACSLLWRRRQDFELVATADPPGAVDPFTRYVGWQSQEGLPRHLHAAGILVVPTVAQDALGRTAVEAMAAGRPVVASRLGGLPFTVADGATGLLFEPGDARDLAAKLETLLDDPGLCERLGQAGRRRFEEHYAWPVIIEKHYRPLLCRRRR